MFKQIRSVTQPAQQDIAVWTILNGVNDITLTEPPPPFGAFFDGIRRVATIEFPEIGGGVVDIGTKSSQNQDTLLVSEILGREKEDIVTFRESIRYVPRLRRTLIRDRSAVTHCQPDGTYMITGGLGGLGSLLAEWLVSIGARRLLLIGKTSLPPREKWGELVGDSSLGTKTKIIRNLESRGVSVHLGCFDISDRKACDAFFKRFDAEKWPRIRGIIHAAGVSHDCKISELTRTVFQKVAFPKALGAWNLHQIFYDTPLDFFICCSSAAAFLPSRGGASYTASNSFLDSLCFYRKAMGKPAMTVNFGPVQDVGMAGKRGREASLNARGVTANSPKQVVDSLNHLVGTDVVQSTILNIDWQKFAQSPSNEKLINFTEQFSKAITAEKADPLDQTEGQDVSLFLKERIGEIMMEDPKNLDSKVKLNEFGFDSIMAVQLSNEIELRFGCQVPTDSIADTTIETLSKTVSDLSSRE